MCDGCWHPISHLVWVVLGPVACFGKCVSCGEWESARKLVGLKPGGRRDAWIGTCGRCA